MKLILTRHGETVSNREGRIMGRSDSPLTSEGLRTAKRVTRMLRHEGITRAFCSSLRRATTTAAIYVDGLEVQAEPTEAMAELSCGEWEGRSRMEATQGRGVLRTSWTEQPPGGESYRDAVDRVRPFVRHLEDLDEEETILVTAHATVNRVFLFLLLGLDTHTAMRINSPHDVYYVTDGANRVMAKSVDGDARTGLLLYDELPAAQ